MVNVKTSGPKVRQIVIYNDAVYGNIAALITAVNATNGTVTLCTFPPGAASATPTGVRNDYTGAATGTWRYEEVDYA
jgi:hypothetical protein